MIAPRHKYQYRVGRSTAAEKVVHMVGPDKRVLELGSGPGSITRVLKENGCRVIALELDEKARELVAPYCERVHACDLNAANWPALLSDAEKMEVIVAADVLEHLYDPWGTLKKMAPLLSENGYVVISIPHAGHNALVAALIAGRFDYQPWGLLDRTHIRFFGLHNIQALFEDAGFKIVEAEFVTKAPEHTEFAAAWRALPAKTREALGSNRYGAIYQVVVRAVPHAATGKALDLASVAVPAPATDVVAWLVSHMSLETRAKLTRLLDRLRVLRR